MDYIQGLTVQTEIFFLSLGFGFLLGILYDIFRTVRLIISRSAGFTVFMDVLYFVLSAFLVFFFNLIVDEGKIRLYVLLGDLLGWLIYYFSFGAISIRLSNRVILVSGRFFKMICKAFLPLMKLLNRLKRKIYVFSKKIIKKLIKKQNMT